MLPDIQQKIATGAFEFSKHAVDQSIIRNITVRELLEVIAGGEVIEDYPNDKYGPSCLIYGRTTTNRPLHIQCTTGNRPRVKIITLYEPDPSRWAEFKQRRQP